MKKIYMILGAALISGGVFGQISKPKAAPEKAVERISASAEIPQYTDRDIIWENTLSDPSEWSLGNDGPVDINFEIGTGLSTGGAATIATIDSDSYSDGCAMVDSDEFANQTGVENCWFQTNNPIDCEDHPYVQIEFANQYYMWDGGASDGNEYCLLEISTDGTTWPDISTTEVSQADPGTRFELWPNMQTQDVVANPTITKFNISEVAGGEEEVYLRFRWVGTYGYAWFIDDIVVYDGFENDLSIEGEAFADGSSYTNLNGTQFVAVEGEGDDLLVGLEYTQYPESQRPNIMAFTPVINWGANDVEEAVLSGTFNGTTLSSDPQPIAAGAAIDSISVLSWPTDGLATGTYDVDLDITSELTDEFNDNNTTTASLEMTEFIMARDDNEISGGFPGGLVVGEAFSGGPLFEIFGDATVYAIDFALTTNTVELEECLVQLLDGGTENFDPLGNSQAYAIETDQYNDFSGDNEVIWNTLVLDSPINVQEGDLVLPVVTYFGGDGVQIGEAQGAPDQTAFIFGDFGTAGVDWYFTNDVPMVRLNFNPNAVNVGVDDSSIEDLSNTDSFGLGQNMPNPSTGVTTINYELFQGGNVVFEVFDITGKVVHSAYEGYRGTGDYAFQLDTQAFNAGMYTYTLTVNGERLTKKMIVK